MSIQTLKDRLPDYAKDLKLNLGSLAAETVLNDTLKAGTFVAAAFASRNPEVIAAINADFGGKLAPADFTAAKAAAAIMGMNNVYYRALHMMHNPEYRTLPARLRMNLIANPGVDKTDFELWSMAVSAITGCGACLDAHETELKKRGVPNTAIQAALRIAAVVNGVSRVMAGEAAANG